MHTTYPPHAVVVDTTHRMGEARMHPRAGSRRDLVRARESVGIYARSLAVDFPILVLGHVLSPVRSIPRHSLLLIANYTSELVHSSL